MLRSPKKWQTDKLYDLEIKIAPSLASFKNRSNLQKSGTANTTKVEKVLPLL